ncbi:MAG: hypothetical protein Q7S40_12460 [Opitutaceae bacterium]|nr:hypothetical protein [Opitutaceae bacterium]
MKSLRKLLTAPMVMCCFALTAIAAENSPNGIWKWTTQGRGGGQSYEQTLKLDYRDGQLTGTLMGIQSGRFQLPDTAISDATFKDGLIKFAVSREFNGNKVTTRYEGKIQGDTITGWSERPGMDGGAAVKRDWNARRTK